MVMSTNVLIYMGVAVAHAILMFAGLISVSKNYRTAAVFGATFVLLLGAAV